MKMVTSELMEVVVMIVDNAFDFSEGSDYNNVIGDANPDFVLNMSNSINYKNFSV